MIGIIGNNFILVVSDSCILKNILSIHVPVTQITEFDILSIITNNQNYQNRFSTVFIYLFLKKGGYKKIKVSFTDANIF